MLAIRLQRVGRKGHAQYRVIVQDSRFSPKSGRVVRSLGSYNPHTKEATIDTEQATKYLTNGAQPSDRSASILKEAGVKLPKWYNFSQASKKSTKHPEKLRKNRPAEQKTPINKEEPKSEVSEPTQEVEIENEVKEVKIENEQLTTEVEEQTIALDTEPSDEVKMEKPEVKV